MDHILAPLPEDIQPNHLFTNLLLCCLPANMWDQLVAQDLLTLEAVAAAANQIFLTRRLLPRAGHQHPLLPEGIPPATRGGCSSLRGAPVLLKTVIAALMGSASINPNLVAMTDSATSYVSGRE
jgi:hypothetical protein